MIESINDVMTIFSNQWQKGIKKKEESQSTKD